MSATQLMEALLAFPADKLDKAMIKYVCETFIKGTPIPEPKVKKPRKPADPSKPKRVLNDTLVAYNACWRAKKATGMSFDDFKAFWKTLGKPERLEWVPKVEVEVKPEVKDDVKEEEEVDEVVDDDINAAIDDIASGIIDEE